ncbi:MAG: CBS domain-containing protein [Nitrososphaera sp.]|uniref:CBS domain-containing protein n=1 Tax=Nitrososphaera sp. TaxID=1971748 RepID=UPI003D6FEDFB
MNAGKIADRTFVSLDENIIVAEAAKAMYQSEGCSIIVTRNDPESKSRIPVGMITERDIIFRIVAQNRGPFKVALKDIMSAPLITIYSYASTEEALSLMKKNNIGRLPVLNRKGVIVGLLTTKTLVRKVPIGKAARSEAQ